MKKQILYSALIVGLIGLMGCKKDPGLGSEDASSFMKSYGTASRGYDILQTDDFGYIMVGSQGNESGVLVIKTDKYGNTKWSKTFTFATAADTNGQSESLLSRGFRIKQDASGYVIVGNATSQFQGSQTLLLKIDENGNKTGSRLYGNPDNIDRLGERGYGIEILPSGNYVLASERIVDGFRIGIGREINNVSLDTIASTVGTIESGGTLSGNVGFRDVLLRSNGQIVFLGYKSGQGNPNYLLTYFRSEEIAKGWIDGGAYEGGISATNQTGWSMLEDENGDFISCGVVGDINQNPNPAFEDESGSMFVTSGQFISPEVAQQTWSFSNESSTAIDMLCYDLTKSSDGFIICGTAQLPGDPNLNQLYLAKLNATGTTILWEKNYGFTGLDEARSIIETNEGKLAICGTCADERGNTTMCLIKTDKNGNIE